MLGHAPAAPQDSQHSHDHDDPNHRHELGAQGAHAHSHAHAGPHNHSHAPASFDRAFAVGIALNCSFVLAEVLFGLHAKSLALLADAGHNLGDVLGLALAWAGAVLARREPTERRTYGLRRFSVLAAMGNAAILFIAVGAIAIEAIQRMRAPAAVATGTVIAVAAAGIVINLVTALGFMRGRHGDLNVRGAFLHMVGDAAVSAGVVIAAIAIQLTGLLVIDPIVSLVIAALIGWGSWSLARDSANLALDAVPQSIDPTAVRAQLMALDGVVNVHDLHIWAMSTTEVALTAHLLRPCACGEDALLADATQRLSERFGIGHVTLQLERGQNDFPCGQARPGAV